MVKRLLLLVIVVAAAAYIFVFRTEYFRPTAYERSGEAHHWLDNGFSVAVVWPKHREPSLVEGVTMALDEINAGHGPLAGKVHLRVYNETEDARGLAQRIVDQKDVLAVIGYELGDTPIQASLTYEKHGVLFIAAKSTDIRLTEHHFQYVFRMSLDDQDDTHALAQFAVDHKWPRVGVLSARTDHGEQASGEFVQAASELGLKIPVARSFFHEQDPYEQDFRQLLAEVRARQFDALMVADELPWAGKLLVDMGKMGVTEPILATSKLDSGDLWGEAGKAANNVYVASGVDPESKLSAYIAFRDRFHKRFNTDPDYGAAQGYEAFMLFASACQQSMSADPIVVATTLRTNSWHGIFGEVSFEENGDLIGRAVVIKHMQDGVFRTVAAEKDVE